MRLVIVALPGPSNNFLFLLTIITEHFIITYLYASYSFAFSEIPYALPSTDAMIWSPHSQGITMETKLSCNQLCDIRENRAFSRPQHSCMMSREGI